jgi:hypothetical protein
VPNGLQFLAMLESIKSRLYSMKVGIFISFCMSVGEAINEILAAFYTWIFKRGKFGFSMMELRLVLPISW